MQKSSIALMVALIFSITLSGCSTNAGNENGGQPIPRRNATDRGGSPQQNPKRVIRPEIKQDTIRLEGEREPLTLKLFDSSIKSFGVPFTTYYPQDMIAETFSSDEGQAVRFVANFNDNRNDDAFLQVFFYQEGADEAQARGFAKKVADSYGISKSRATTRNYQWSLEEHTVSYKDEDGASMVGTVALGRHSNRFFHVIIHYPPEYADGFAPRAGRILEEWRWEDTGEKL